LKYLPAFLLKKLSASLNVSLSSLACFSRSSSVACLVSSCSWIFLETP